MKRILRVTALTIVSGCSVLGLPDDDQGRLNQARAAWARLGIHDYEIHIDISCFCPPEMLQPLVVTVRSDTVVSVMSDSGGVARRFEPFTVEELFDNVQQAINTVQDGIPVTYDQQYHFPTHISYYRKNALDSGMSINAGPLSR